MTALVLARWIATKWAREPWKWALLVGLVALWPAVNTFAPFGASPTPSAAEHLVYEIAFVAAGLGAACALDALEVLPTCAYALGLRPGWSAEWVAMAVTGMAVQGAALALPLLTTKHHEVPVDVELVLLLSLNSAGLASVGVMLLRVHMPTGMRPLALLALTWILPALAPGPFVAGFLGMGARLTIDEVPTRALVASRIATISALLLAAHLMDAQRRQRS